ncbi:MULTISPECIES: NADP-dependent oxidoreductase [unclassified Shewanella]|uniref:NADP-dependent oxidoreductase n=1 Tax=unclassified Shewanella TaxID=196818 RepID=UPI000970E29A|nr:MULTISPECIES: NADP-dependent oxidoreductase [unclassified Shewanella]MDO6618909.1 NADP-dependent oxidoreductase [Shewanella sp. 6_MG-2023]MDO6677924.1 NADP-dependent oxidoreductase [Shewanella sp. 4_MG-2023]MDO6775302.1 NADP-dependent oxidoreductase [Shewanella sp. 3_MG-2023]PMG29621.1 NADP-dependent oxidoreductase [Shewanella sp. 10N.286.52.C2]PMG39776.1 NADP-dependent oxidoreductase [Shewanella sp. 10N.286.52.B9]
MSTFTAINLVKRPQGGPITADIFEVVQKPMPTVNPGEILVKQNHMSLDPAMFGWMQPDTDSYIPPVNLGEVMRSSGVGEVVESHHPDFKVGDRVMGMMGWQEYFHSNGQGLNKVDAPLPDEAILSVFALPGLTATQGLFNVGKPKAGETIIVTGAAGSVGSIVGQLAKADGLTVIGVVGSDEKADWIVNELGFDSAINYKTDDLEAKLAQCAPNGIDLFFENTAGPIQSLIIDKMNPHGRVMVCGLIADYSSQTPAPGPSWMNILKRRLTIQGFTMPDHFGEVPSLLAKLTPYVLQGKIKHRAHVLNGLESSIDGLNLFFSGANKGKLMVKL